MKPPSENGEEQQEEEEQGAPPSQLVSIGRYSFGQCETLQSVRGLEHASETLQEIESEAFLWCKSLIHVNFLSRLTRLQSLGPRVFPENIMTHVDMSNATNLTELPSGAFSRCRALVIVHLPPNLCKIWDSAFWGCAVLQHIQLPDGLQSIDDHVFFSCRSLRFIALPASLLQIGLGCFHGCEKLACLWLASSRMPLLTKRPFSKSCESLSSLQLPTQVQSKKWPLVLEQFCKEDGIASTNGGIVRPKNRNTIVWNFLCHNMAQLFMEDNSVISRRRPTHHHEGPS